MKSGLFVLSFIVILAAGSFASTDSLYYYEIEPQMPAPGEDFKITVEYSSNPCATENASIEIVEGTIYIDIDIVAETICPTAAIYTTTHEFAVSGLEKGVYPVHYNYSFDYPDGYPVDIVTENVLLCNLLVGLSDIQTCVVHSLYNSTLTVSGGFAGITETYPVRGTFSYVKTGTNGWLTDVGLYAFDETGQKIFKIAKVFGLSQAAIYIENGRYTGDSYFDGGKAITDLAIDYTSEPIILSGSVTPGCCDRFEYSLSCFARFSNHSLCRELPASDLNKDCKVNMLDLSIMVSEWLDYRELWDFAILASEWMDCHLLDVEDCI